MKEIIQRFEKSIQDTVLSKNERREIKQLILESKLSNREMDFLRSQIFDMARRNHEHFSKDQLIEWIETSNKITQLSREESNSNYAYFSPGTACQSAIINQIRSAVSSVKICVFTISDDAISREILSAHKRGVGVKLLTDNDKSFDRGSDIEMLAQNGVNIKIDDTENHMHHKFCVIDKKKLLSGSYNWTRSAAERNQENLILTEDHELVKSFLKEFESLWDNMHSY